MTDNSNLSRRRFLQATGGAATATALAGCLDGEGGTPTPTDTATPTPTPGDTPDTDTPDEGPEQSDKLYRLVNSSMDTLDPIKATDTASGTVIQQVFDALFNYPSGHTTPEPLLVDSFESSPGGQILTFTLRDDVTFSNGDPVTARDVWYSWERLAASDNSRRGSFLLGDLGVSHNTNSQGDYIARSMAVATPDEKTVQLELSSPFHAALEMLSYTAFAVLPEGVVGDIKGYDGQMGYEEFSTQNPIGAGAYTLDKWEQETEVQTKARAIEDYPQGDGPFTSGTHWQILENTNAIYTYATLNVNADHPSVPSSKYDRDKVNISGKDETYGYEIGEYGPLENGLTADLYRTPELATFYYGFNMDVVPKWVRQAVAHVFSAQEVIDKFVKSPTKAAYMFTPPGIWPGGAAEYDSFAEDYPYGKQSQLGEAETLIQNNGHSQDNPYELTLTTFDYQLYLDWAGLLRDKLASVGIQLEIETSGWSTFLDRGRNGNLDFFQLGWIADYPAPDNFLKLLNPEFTLLPYSEHPESQSFFNWTKGSGSARQDALNAWQKFNNNPRATESDQQARNEAYKTIERANWEDVAMIHTTHSIAEHMEYKWVDKPLVGPMGGSRASHNHVKIGERQDAE